MTNSAADGYVFVKGCDSCPLRRGGICDHPTRPGPLFTEKVPKGKAHPECPLRKHSLHIALEPTA